VRRAEAGTLRRQLIAHSEKHKRRQKIEGGKSSKLEGKADQKSRSWEGGRLGRLKMPRSWKAGKRASQLFD